MFCLSCQTHIQRKTLDDYFKRITLCIKCARFKDVSFEESRLPYHHVSLTLKYSSVFKTTVLESRIAEDILKTQGEVLKFTKDQKNDALMFALLMESTLYLYDYLTLDLIAYIQELETIPVVLITA